MCSACFVEACPPLFVVSHVVEVQEEGIRGAATSFGSCVAAVDGHPRSNAELEREWRGKGTRPGTVLVARLARGHQAWLVEQEHTG